MIGKIASLAKYSGVQQGTLYAVIAYLFWWIGKPAAALENARYALAADPSYSLAKLIVKAVEAQVPRLGGTKSEYRLSCCADMRGKHYLRTSKQVWKLQFRNKTE
ncbi:hypothetical protein RQN30_00385 [Arcanobacterium hippocoleae]